MDAVSYSYADSQKKKIDKFIEEPTSDSGLITMPTIIEVGETSTIPADRQSVVGELLIDGDLVLDGDIVVIGGVSKGNTEILLRSPDNSLWSITIDDSGVLATTKV